MQYLIGNLGRHLALQRRHLRRPGPERPHQADLVERRVDAEPFTRGSGGGPGLEPKFRSLDDQVVVEKRGWVN